MDDINRLYGRASNLPVSLDQDILAPQPDAERDNLQRYLQEIARFPRLKPDEEHACARQVQQQDQQAYQRMIESNLRLVVHVARRYTPRPGLTLLDLIAEGNLGLIQAVQKFDPERGCRFSTYAVWWIADKIERCLLQQLHPLYVPVYLLKESQQTRRQRDRISSTSPHRSTPAELARQLHKPQEKICQLLQIAEPVRLYLDQGMATESQQPQLQDKATPSPGSQSQTDHLQQLLCQALQQLNQRQYQVLAYRFGLDGLEPQTLDSLALRLGMTREGIRQIQLQALRILQQNLVTRGIQMDDLLMNE